MNRIPLLLVLALSVGTAVADSSRSNIRARCKTFVAAWNAHDAEALASHWAPDGDVINPMGQWGQGRAEIQALFEKEHSTMMANSRLTVKEQKIRFLEDDVAVVDEDVVLHGMRLPNGEEHPPMSHHVTSVMQKSGGQWWIASCRPYVFLTGQKSGACEKTSKCSKCAKGKACAKCAKAKGCTASGCSKSSPCSKCAGAKAASCPKTGKSCGKAEACKAGESCKSGKCSSCKS